MDKRKLNFLLIALIGMTIIFYSADAFARENSNQNTVFGLDKMQAGKVTQSLSNIGNWAFWANYNGQTGHDPFTGSSGGFYPRGTSTIIYMDGIIWGGYMRVGATPRLRTGGIGYRIGTIPGWVDATGAPVDPNTNDRVRMYRIRADWATLTDAQVKQDASEIYNVPLGDVTETQTQEIIAQYKADWLNWPVDLGAPFVDKNGNGAYEPVFDADGYPDPLAQTGEFPGIANADQVLWWVVNDMNVGAVASHSGVPPMGLELQITLWAYNQPGAGLGQIVFKKYRFINKSGTYIDSMFVAQYSDPDCGDYGDDLVGCDVEKSLHFVYNGGSVDAEYVKFGLKPPSAGYDFFQGPLIKTDIATDTAVFDLKYRSGYKNLPMTSFGYFAAGGLWSDPPMGVIDFTLQWYNMLNGYLPTNDTINPTPFKYGSGPNKGLVTKFPADGDPVTDLDGSLSDIDGQGDNMGAADRRMFASTGPFTMAPLDTQELVVALIGGLGGDYLQSINVMKEKDVLAQKLYDDLFASVPKAPPAPKVVIANTDESIVLSWGADLAAMARTEALNPVTGYDFEGYNVYQLPSASASVADGKRLVTFDLVNGIKVISGKRFLNQYGQVVEVPVQFGADKGVQRFFVVDQDYLNGKPLYAGSPYYLAVTAYNYNAAPKLIEDKTLESAPIVFEVFHQGPKAGVRYGTKPAEAITVKPGQNNVSDGSVEVTVVDPSVTTGNSYKVNFVVDGDTNSATYGQTVWNLLDTDLSTTVLSKQVQLDVADPGRHAPLADGLQIKVYGPSPGAKDWDIPVGTRRFTWAGGAGAFGFETFEGAIGWAQPATFWGSGYNYPPDKLKDVVLKLAKTDTNGVYDPADENVSYGYRFGRGFANPPVKSEFGPYIINAVGGYSYQDFTKSVPLAAYDVSDPANLRRLVVGHLENNALGGMVDGKYWPPFYNDADNTAASGPREWLYIYDVTYSETADPALQVELTGNDLPIMYWCTMARRAAVAWSPTQTGEDQFAILANHINTPADEFTFAIPANTNSAELAKADVEKVNVFPNPYYAFNPLEANRFDRFVKFNHLPNKATIRIFNLAGVQVRKLEKNNTDQFLPWNLQNESGLPVASGIYIIYVDMPDQGKTKVLKLMVIQSEQVLEFF